MNLNDFSLNLLRTIEGNVFCSPKNIQDCLAMIYVGAKGNTLQAFNDSTGLSLNKDESIAAIQHLNEVLIKSQDYVLQFAYGAWAQENIHFDENYLNFIDEFKARLSKVDYSNDGNYPAIAKDINNFVSDATKGKITNLVDKNFFNKSSIITLVSAIYFLGKFQKSFNKKNTLKSNFFVEPNNPIELDMMQQENNFSYAENDDIQSIELPYNGEELVLQIILPKNNLSIESQIDDRYLSDLKWRNLKVNVRIPKFKVESTIDLNQTFSKVGLSIIMDDSADFSGICPDDHIKVGAAIHKAFIDIDEEGTEAAAATAIGMRCTAIMSEKMPIYFVCNHPFIYMIKHRPSNTILFLGRFLGK